MNMTPALKAPYPEEYTIIIKYKSTIKPETIKLLDENIGKTLSDIWSILEPELAWNPRMLIIRKTPSLLTIHQVFQVSSHPENSFPQSPLWL